MDHLSVPSCYKYIKTKEGEADYQRIYGVAVSAYQTKYPDAPIIKEEIFRYLQLSQVIPEKYNPELLNMDYVELCFSIISQFQCNSICQICPYSTLYRNTHEKEETIVLGFALSTWENLQRIIQAGVTSRLFRAMIPVSEKSKVMVVPLNRLAFEYLEKIPKSQEDMLSITDKIISILKRNNQNKLSASDFKIAKKYLDNLYNGNYTNCGDDVLKKALKDGFNISVEGISSKQQLADTNKSAPPVNNKPLESKPAAHINGFLGKRPIQPEPQAVQKPDDKILQSASGTIKPKIEQKTLKEENIDNNEKTADQKIISTYTVTNNLQPERQHSTFLQFPWKLTKKDLKEKKTIILSQTQSFNQSILQEDLLLTPLLPMEVINVEGTSVLLFMANHKFYCFERNNPVILDMLLPYVTASSYRKILCYEPYLLYSYFASEQAFDVTITGLRFYFALFKSLSSLKLYPAEAIAKICRINQTNFPDMLALYKKTQLVFEKMLAKEDTEKVKQFREMNHIAKIVGYSETSHSQFYPAATIVNAESQNGYIFNYKPGSQLKGTYRAVTFFLHWNDESSFPTKEMLSILSDDIIFRKGSALLRFDEYSIVFAVLPEHYDYLCDKINEIGYRIAKKYKKLPVMIDEKV